MDFSYLAKYQNIHFVICLRPIANNVKDFKMICPPTVTSPSSDDASATEIPIQHYQELKVSHRCSLPIWQHLREFQKNDPNSNGYPNIDLEEIPDQAALPPVLDPPGCGVIWVPCGIGAEAETKGLNEVKNILVELKDDPSVSIIYEEYDDDENENKRLADSLCHGNNPTSWNGPHSSYSFNGFESSVVVYICDGYLHIQTMARARQLLIIVTHGRPVNHPSNYDAVFKPMNNSVEKGFVRIIELHHLVDQFMTACQSGQLQEVQTILDELKTKNMDKDANKWTGFEENFLFPISK